jgi:hypothetical protein
MGISVSSPFYVIAVTSEVGEVMKDWRKGHNKEIHNLYYSFFLFYPPYFILHILTFSLYLLL